MIEVSSAEGALDVGGAPAGGGFPPAAAKPASPPAAAAPRLSDAEAVEALGGVRAACRPALDRRGYRFAKRAFDVVASGIAVLVLLVPGLALSAVICAKSPGAGPLYGQTRCKRVGKDGSVETFRMWKFRSMVPHADGMLGELQGANEATGPLFKMRDDPRVIPGVGTFIRRHSIDELPQLLNVLKGDMSLIGPRPPLPREVVQYGERHMRRLAVKPGCGGLWQVSGRSDTTFDEMVELDLEYIEKRSFAYDLKLVARTAGAMLSGEGAA